MIRALLLLIVGFMFAATVMFLAGYSTALVAFVAREHKFESNLLWQTVTFLITAVILGWLLWVIYRSNRKPAEPPPLDAK